MGGVCDTPTPESERNKAINDEIKGDKKNRANTRTIKLLLLGTGDSGKSTFLKQMKRIHTEGFTDQERIMYLPVLRDNCLQAIKVLVLATHKWKLKMPPKLRESAQQIKEAQQLTPEIGKLILKLWQCKAVQQAYTRENELQIPTGANCHYLFESAKRFADQAFSPTDEDICRARSKTNGVIEMSFFVSGIKFEMVDVGGQRAERRKWLGCFDGIDAVIYLVAINEYDMVLEEDGETNRLIESIKLFQKLSQSKWFRNKSFILFLNKSDLFADKIKKKPLPEYFTDYDEFLNTHPNRPDDSEGDETAYKLGCSFMKSQFKKYFGGSGGLYPFITCAIDKENCKRVFNAVRDEAIRAAITTIGI